MNTYPEEKFYFWFRSGRTAAECEAAKWVKLKARTKSEMKAETEAMRLADPEKKYGQSCASTTPQRPVEP